MTKDKFAVVVKRLARRTTILAFLAGMVFGSLLFLQWAGERQDGAGAADSGFWLTSGLMKEAHALLDEGEYAFFPNRRSVWVVNQTNGRMATYFFRDDELQSVDRSRVAQIDLKTFPMDDTLISLSDRNLNHILWLCNTRTGDFQMWQPTRDGILKPTGPVPSSTDLLDRPTTGR